VAFTLPTFNLTCNIHTTAAGTNTFRLTSDCNLALGRRVTMLSGGFGTVAPGNMYGAVPTLLFPALTDVRDSSCGGGQDIIECPAGSGRWYTVELVDDIGKGFANEHRYAIVAKIWGFTGNGAGLTLPWPTPIP